MPARFAALVSCFVVFGSGAARADLFVTDPDMIVAADPDEIWPPPSVEVYESIQEAIEDAAMFSPTRIEVRKGTYVEDVDLLGKDIVLYALDGPAFTTISGLAGSSNPTIRCVTGETSAAAIIGFTITGGGQFNGSTGGGIEIDGASPSIIGCTIRENEAYAGAGIAVTNGDPLILNCTLWGNEAAQFGGAIFLENADAEIVNCTMANNICFTSGGAVRAFADSDPFIANSILWNNHDPMAVPNVREITWDTTSEPVLHTCTVDLDADEVPDPTWTNISLADPAFLELIDIDGDGPDLRLSETSPCVDAGDGAFLPPDSYDLDLDGDALETTPLDGQMRLRRWDVLVFGEYIVDKGAQEYTCFDASDTTPVKRSELGVDLWSYSEDPFTVFTPYSSTSDLFELNDAITRVVFVIPSSGRGVNFSVRSILGPAGNHGLQDETLIISPQFLIARDLGLGGFGFDTVDILYWDSGWNQASMSSTGVLDDNDCVSAGPEPPFGAFGPRDIRVPSFTLVDEMITHIVESGNFPNVEKIIITGHSSGGQFSQRYALSSPVEDDVVRPAGISMRYVPTAPGLYTFISPDRPADPSVTRLRKAIRPEWETPADCPGYDDYRNGLSGGFKTYHIDLFGEDPQEIAAAMRDQYERREVIVLIDLCDSDPDSSSLPPGCEALKQGAHRLERAQNYFANVVRYYGPHVLGWQRLAIIDDGECPDTDNDGVPDLGFMHSSVRNYSSRMGKRWVLDVDIAPPPGTGPELRRVHVDDQSMCGDDGLDWPSAFCDLQDASLGTAAWGGDITEIRVAGGTYLPDRTDEGNRLLSFPLMENIELLGGFGGLDNPSDPDHRDTVQFPSVLSGDLDGDSGDVSQDSYSVVTAYLVTRSAVLDGFTVEYGAADGLDPPDTPSGTLLGVGLTFGGGISAWLGSPTIRHTTIRHCRAENGGGIAALFDEGGFCGAVPRAAAGLLAEDVTIRDCIAEFDGGGAYTTLADPTLVQCRLVSNQAARSGAIFLSDSEARIRQSTFSENTAAEAGGAAWIGGELAEPLITNSLFDLNVSNGTGGAIHSLNNAIPEFVNCTITRSTAADGNGAVFMEDVSELQTAAFFRNTLLWNNAPTDIAGVPPVITYSFYEGADGLGNIFEELSADAFVDVPAGDFRLAAGHPAIDAAENEALPIGALLDLNNAPRFVDDPGTIDTGVPGQGFTEVVDMGAYEFQGETPTCTGDLDGSGVVDVSDLLSILAAWGPCADCLEDLNDDGAIDVEDLLALLASWGPCA